MKRLYGLLLAWCVGTVASAQFRLPYSASQIRQMERLSAETTKKEQENTLKAIELARKNNWLIGETRSDGTVVRLRGVNEVGEPVYDATDNNSLSALDSRTTSLYSGGSLGVSLNGSSPQMAGRLAIWDGGKVLNTHVEFGSRITQVDNAASVDNHATHTSGTMIAAGLNPLARGMAWGAALKAYEFTNDLAEMNAEAPNLLISNHSYGTFAGFVFNTSRTTATKWEWYGNTTISTTEDYKLGFYDTNASSWDKLAYNAPYYLLVKSAGNKRTETGPAAGQYYFLGSSTRDSSNVVRSRNDAYDTLPTYSNAKNALIVAAVNPMATAPTGPANIQMSSFSSWGPTDDGRIKPDISGVGVNVLSTYGTGTTTYGILSGTSMSSPHVAGSLFVLQEYYSTLNDKQFMRSATLRGLVIHTADEAGDASGPDYRFGWGFLNIEKAAKVIQNTDKNHQLVERVLAQSETFTQQVVASGRGPLVATICWTDPEADATPVTAANLNSRTPKLINDLDIRISDGTTTSLPWILDPNNPSAAATRGDNIRDNVEQVYIANPVPGKTYTITVSHKGTLSRAPQNYALIVSGIGGTAYCASAASNNADSKINKVVFGSINNTAAAGCATYTDFTNLSTDVSVGQTIPIEVTLGTCGANADKADKIAKVFIDWNGDADFDDANELVATSGVINGTGSFKANITVPSVTIGNSTRMRVVCTETNDATKVTNCGSYTKGETQEYLISFVRPAKDASVTTLISPEGGICSNTTQTASVRVKNVGSETLQNIPVSAQVLENGTVVATLTGTVASLASQLETVVNLTGTFNAKAGTTYEFRVSTNLNGDQDPSNNQLVTTRSVSAINPNPTGTATTCSNNLQLQGNGNGTIYWYDAPTGGNLLGAGNSLSIASRPAGSTVYAALNEFSGSIGRKAKTDFPKGGYNQFSPSVRVTTLVPVVLESARLYIGNSGKITFSLLRESDGSLVSSVTLNVTATRNPAAAGAQTDDATDQGAIYQLNLNIPTPGSYQIAIDYEDGATIFRNNEISANPYPLTLPNIMSIVGNTATTTPEAFYYYFYDLKVKSYGCLAAARTPVTVTNGTLSTATISGDKAQSYCPNASLVLNANAGASAYQWQRNGQNIANATQSTLTVSTVGTYRVVVTQAGNCPTPSDTVRVAVKSPALPTVSRNDNIFTASGGSSYQWLFNGQPISNATATTYTALQSGTYSVRAVVDGCTVESLGTVLFVTAVEEPTVTSIKAYPNPTTNRLVVEYTPDSSLVSSVDVSVQSVLGIPLVKQPLTRNGKTYTAELNLSQVPNGTIFVSISDGKQVFIKKITKQ
ncbi:MAG: S8 family serine peptidase [Spirosomataceae bacterium]